MQKVQVFVVQLEIFGNGPYVYTNYRKMAMLIDGDKKSGFQNKTNLIKRHILFILCIGLNVLQLMKVYAL